MTSHGQKQAHPPFLLIENAVTFSYRTVANSLIGIYPRLLGYAVPRFVQNVVRAFASVFAAEVSTDVHGNVLVTLNPGGSSTILLDAHCDQRGLIVRHIDNRSANSF